MLGLINDCAEQLVITKFGIDAWHAIKEKAGCTVKDYHFEQHGLYPDSATVDIVVAAAEALSVTVDDILELFGQFFIDYTISKGYDNLLRCQGSTLRLWLSNLNSMHDHLQSSLPGGKFPAFWCENCVDHEGSILLHYHSVRGPLLCGVVVGIVKEVATLYFDVEVIMDRVAVQGDNDSECSTWRISATDPTKKHKLTMTSQADSDAIIMNPDMRYSARRATLTRANQRGSYRPESCNNGTSESGIMLELQCPFSQTMRSLSDTHNSHHDCAFEYKIDYSDEERILEQNMDWRLENSENLRRRSKSSIKSAHDYHPQSRYHRDATQILTTPGSDIFSDQNGLSSSKVRSIFPYHVMVNEEFTIVQTGNALPEMLMREYNDLIGLSIEKVFKFTKPILAGFHWPTLQRLADQKFFLVPLPFDDLKTGARIDVTDVKFKGNIIQIVEGGNVMFVLSPDAENITELTQMGLTMSDLPLHSFQRDVVFLGEHIASEVRTAHKLDRLSKHLEKEKNVSNTLLNSMLPPSVAECLRAGKTVEPHLYENVTLFFSDVVGFTQICDVVEPWDVIDMLNQLYTIMDHLASHFNLYKVETIGDAYMCCSGLPTPDENHAQNIANFALAVAECVQLVESPSNGVKLQLRIGIHTGHCMGGVVGTLTPHYCLFGDMVNTTSRHESTCLNGKIQCSSILYEHLTAHPANSEEPLYQFTPRGYVEMKGKGRCFTYWLEGGGKHNHVASPERIKELFREVKGVLSKKTWKKRKYFNFCRRRSSTFGGNDDDGTHSVNTVGSTIFRTDSSVGCVDVNGSECVPTTTNSVHSLIASSETDGNSNMDYFSDHDTVSLKELKNTAWPDLQLEIGLSRLDLVASTHGLISSLLWKCTNDVEEKMPENKGALDTDLLRFVDRISSLYESHHYHSWEHACQVTLSATFLILEYHNSLIVTGDLMDVFPFIRFITVFAALIHDVKHHGLPNSQLEKEGHNLCHIYQESYLERQSIQVGLCIFIEEFPELSSFVLKMCPEFLHLVSYAVLATDVWNKTVQVQVQERFDRITGAHDYDLPIFDKTRSVVEQILLLADVGHCSQGYDNFLRWNTCFFYECLENYKHGRGEDPQLAWYENQTRFLESYILPLTERCNALVPKCELIERTQSNIQMWKDSGKDWTAHTIDDNVMVSIPEQRLRDQHNKGYSEFLSFIGHPPRSHTIDERVKVGQQLGDQHERGYSEFLSFIEQTDINVEEL